MTTKANKSAIKAALLRVEALEAEMVDINTSDRSEYVKAAMWRGVWASYQQAADYYETISGKLLA